MSAIRRTVAVLAEVAAERTRQHAKWGEQNHENGTGADQRLLRDQPRGRRPSYGRLCELAKIATDGNAAAGNVTFADILLEEVLEALAEEHPQTLRNELIQVAAVAAQWVEAIDRKAASAVKPHIWKHVRDDNRRGVHYFSKTYFLKVYRNAAEDREAFGGHIQLVLSKPRPEFGARFHVGARWSETPFDGHLTILGSGIFWGLSTGGKLAEWITKGTGREVSAAIHHAHLWLKFWSRADGNWKRGDSESWREKSFRINPLDIFLGPLRYAYEDIDTVTRMLTIPGGQHTVKLKLQHVTYGRAKGRKTLSWGVDWDARPGIATEPDRGGWKDGLAYGSGFTISRHHGHWADEAIARLASWVYAERAKNGLYATEPKGADQ